MKKIALGLMTTCLSLTFYPLQSNAKAVVEPSSVVISKPAESAEAKALLIRLNEINDMDVSTLNSTEKKQLRKEVRSIKSELNQIGGGVYLSAGAIIIILLLLIILL